jgi:hypothetical protein
VSLTRRARRQSVACVIKRQYQSLYNVAGGPITTISTIAVAQPRDLAQQVHLLPRKDTKYSQDTEDTVGSHGGPGGPEGRSTWRADDDWRAPVSPAGMQERKPHATTICTPDPDPQPRVRRTSIHGHSICRGHPIDRARNQDPGPELRMGREHRCAHIVVVVPGVARTRVNTHTNTPCTTHFITSHILLNLVYEPNALLGATSVGMRCMAAGG